ncbi:MAG: translation initiation factor IF-2 subunit alpha [Thermoplasmatales archaeon]|nr:MAG: translation initiation factor IF-2 subunit alpha [Thermoplasmatales archaeon]
MLKKDYPEVGEFVVGTVIKVHGFGSFVSLDEYPKREGFIHISEIATGWVKHIRNYVREKQKIVCKVLRVDPTKNHIDLSLKRVNEHQRRDKIQEWKNRRRADKLFEMVAENVGRTVEQCYREFGNNLIKNYGSLYDAFEECAYDCNTLKNDGFDGDWLKDFKAIAEDNISIPFVEIKGIMMIKSWDSEGIKHIRDALLLAERSEYEDVEIQIKYVGAPRYLITVRAPDYKIAEGQMKKALQKVTEHIINHKGECEFKRELED